MFDPAEPHPWASAMVVAVNKEQQQQQAETTTSAAASLDKQRLRQPWADAGLPHSRPAPVPTSAQQQPTLPDEPFEGPMDRQMQRAKLARSAAVDTATAEAAPLPEQDRNASATRLEALPSFGQTGPATTDGAVGGSFACQQPREQHHILVDAAADSDSRDSFAFGAAAPACTTVVEEGSRDSFAGFGGLALRLDDDSPSPPRSPAGFAPRDRSAHRLASPDPGEAAVRAAGTGGANTTNPQGASKHVRDAGSGGAEAPGPLPTFLRRAVGEHPGSAVTAAAASLPGSDDSNSTRAAVGEGGTAGAGGRRRSGGGVVALPSPSQLDPAVLDSLPLPIKRELELAYGAPIQSRCMPMTVVIMDLQIGINELAWPALTQLRPEAMCAGQEAEATPRTHDRARQGQQEQDQAAAAAAGE